MRQCGQLERRRPPGMRAAWGHTAEEDHELAAGPLAVRPPRTPLVSEVPVQPSRKWCPMYETSNQPCHSAVLSDAQRTDLYVLLLRHSKATMAETAMYLANGQSIAQIARRRSCLGGDARAIENIVYGYLRHDAATWIRRTARLARALQKLDGLDPQVARNADAVLAEVAARGDGWSLVFEDDVSRELREVVGNL